MSTLPPVTAPAWTSFLTGTDPGYHGIFGFRSRDPVDYRSITIPGGARRRQTLMKLLDDAGFRTCLVTVPWTYPAEPLSHGVVVPGWDAPDESLDSCHPPALGEELRSVVARVPRQSPPRSAPRRFLERQSANIDLREEISGYLLAKIDPQVFMVVFTEPDQATHHFWATEDVPSTLLASYEAVDQAMGRIVRDHVREADRVLVVSDHGGRNLHSHVHVGTLLADGGFLRTTTTGPRGVGVVRDAKRHIWYRLPPALRNAAVRWIPRSARRGASRAIRRSDIDWSATRAFARDDEAAGLGVDINARPRFGRGPVSQGDYASVRRDVADYLAGVTDPGSGQKVFSDVLAREEVYAGPEMASAPDLLLVPAPGFGTRMGSDLTDRVSRVAVGGHRREGVFACDWQLGAGSIIPIADLLPLVLESCGYGRFAEATREDEGSTGYSDVEAREMEDRLRELGYIE
jgi:predicted AlkP superfamily phosphohydrolase/phosphomutase